MAEKANHRHIKIWMGRFDVATRFMEAKGWVVNLAAVRDGGKGMDKSIPEVIAEFAPAGPKTTGEDEEKKKQPRTPYHMKCVVDLIKLTIMEDPSLTNKVLRKVVEPYRYHYAFTESILQDAQKKAKLDLFGMADDKAMYAKGVVAELKHFGRYVELLYSSRAKVVLKLGNILISEENRNR